MQNVGKITKMATNEIRETTATKCFHRGTTQCYVAS